MRFAADVSVILLIFLAGSGVARAEGPVIDIQLHVWPEQEQWFPAPPYGYPPGLSFPGITRMDPKFRADLGRPLQWEEEVLVEHPDLRIVLMPAGWPYLDEMIAIMALYPNVYVDTGAVLHLISPKAFYRYFGVLIDEGFGDRILFGSDQMCWPGAIGYGIEVIGKSSWDEKVKRDILYNNAARFLRLSDETIAAHHAAVGEN